MCTRRRRKHLLERPQVRLRHRPLHRFLIKPRYRLRRRARNKFRYRLAKPRHNKRFRRGELWRSWCSILHMVAPTKERADHRGSRKAMSY